MSSGTLPPCFCSSASFVGDGPASTILSSSMRRVADDLLRAGDVGHPRQLHEDLVVGLPVARDVRLGHAELVDAAIDRLQRLHDRLLAHVRCDVRLHREFVGAAGARAAIVIASPSVRRRCGGTRRRDLPGPLRHGTSSATSTRSTLTLTPAVRSASRSCSLVVVVWILSASSVCTRMHEVHAALEVEPELQLLRGKPAGSGQVVSLRQDRVDADGEENRRTRATHREKFPAKVLVHVI